MPQNHSARPTNALTGIDFSGETVTNVFDTASSVATSTTTTIVTFTVPALTEFLLLEVEGTGDNIATYEVLIDGAVEATWRTWFNSCMGKSFNFRAGLNQGFSVATGKIILLRVTHERPNVGDFEGRIYGISKV